MQNLVDFVSRNGLLQQHPASISATTHPVITSYHTAGGITQTGHDSYNSGLAMASSNFYLRLSMRKSMKILKAQKSVQCRMAMALGKIEVGVT